MAASVLGVAELVLGLLDAAADAATAATDGYHHSRNNSSADSHYRLGHVGRIVAFILRLSLCVFLRHGFDFEAELPFDFSLRSLVDVQLEESAVGQRVVDAQLGDGPVGQVNIRHQILQ